MKEQFTKSSVEAKLDADDINLFAKVCEKGLNEFSKKNQEFTNDFKLTDDQFEFYRLKKFRFLNDLANNEFTKQAVADRFSICTVQNKNKVFIKCYQSKQLVLEIAASKSQVSAIEDKFYYEFDYDKPSNKKYQLFYAGTFMHKDKNSTFLSSKLTDLKLFKIVKI